MALTRMSKKGCGYSRPDRAVALAAWLMVTIVCLLIGFSGPSVDFRLPGLGGWIYIGSSLSWRAPASSASSALMGSGKGRTSPGSKIINAARIAHKRR